MSIEAMKQALDALEESCTPRLSVKHCAMYDEAIDALRQAIEQAGKNQAEFQEFVSKVQTAEKEACEIINREWVGLTDEEVDTAMDVSPPNLGGEFYYDDVQKIARAIEAKLKEKNA